MMLLFRDDRLRVAGIWGWEQGWSGAGMTSRPRRHPWQQANSNMLRSRPHQRDTAYLQEKSYSLSPLAQFLFINLLSFQGVQFTTSCAGSSTPNAVNTRIPHAKLHRKGRCFVTRPHAFLAGPDEYGALSPTFLVVTLTAGTQKATSRISAPIAQLDPRDPAPHPHTSIHGRADQGLDCPNRLPLQ
jgi:hypothetical protein